MNIDQLLEALLGTKASFESVLARVGEAEPVDLLLRLLTSLEGGKDFDNAERERRLSAVFKRASLDSAGGVAVGLAGAKLSNRVLRNALAQLLPPECRGVVFRGKHFVATDAESVRPAERELSDGGIAATVPVAAVPQASENHLAFSDVVILSVVNSPATARLLEKNGFVPLRCQTVEELDKMMATNEEICAFLVESSFLSSISREDQPALLTKLACFSSFVWIRFQGDGLHASEVEVAQHLATVRCRVSQSEVTDVSFRDRAELQERELPFLTTARTRLSKGESPGLFIPGELRNLELRLLGAAMSQFSKKRHFNPGAELTQVTTKFLQGGQTGARVALVKVNGLQVPVIVKLDRKEAILEEARRFLTFIHKDNADLTPEVHLHASAALIVFGIIPGPDSKHEQPAPTLEQQLTDYWYAEICDPVGCSDGATLLKGFSEAAARLSILNKQVCFDKSFRCMANPYIASLKAMEQKGFHWGFGEDVIKVRAHAETQLAEAEQSAICHGDAHTRNVLIRGDQGFLIDYAYSGPGHPCSDLVRLELCVFLTRFVLLGSEDEVAALQRDLSVERMSVDKLLLRHQALLVPRTNQLCLKMCVIARDLAGEVLQAHKLPWEHYLSAKVLTAWQMLQVPGLQQSLARSVISAISR